MKKKHAWILKDDRPGNYNQAIGLASRLGISFDIKEIKYNKLANIPNCLNLFSTLSSESVKNISNDFPDIVISAGRKSAVVARDIKKKSGAKIIQIMSPDYAYNDFDLIILPFHDKSFPRSNIIQIDGALHKITDDLLIENSNKWKDKFDNLSKPYISLLVGGNSKKGRFTIEHAIELAYRVNNLAAKEDASILITTSRRTDDKVKEALINNIDADYFLYDGQQDMENPYFGFLALADILVVTGDSISMCTEACSTGKPVFIYQSEGLMPNKHLRFHENLFAKGHAIKLEKDSIVKKCVQLDNYKNIVKKIQDSLLKKE